MLASELLAVANNTRCEGPEQCHWCGAPCKRLWPHDDPPPIPFVRTTTLALRPANGYVCAGCWLYRRKRVTVHPLRGGFKDGQTLASWSWLLTESGVKVIQPDDHQLLWELLLQPPLKFCLSLRERRDNLVQSAVVNHELEIKSTTTLRFTVDGLAHSWTTLELESALTAPDPNGCEPGVRELLRVLGPYQVVRPSLTEPRKRGRPVGTHDLSKPVKKVVRRSGDYSEAVAS